MQHTCAGELGRHSFERSGYGSRVFQFRLVAWPEFSYSTPTRALPRAAAVRVAVVALTLLSRGGNEGSATPKADLFAGLWLAGNFGTRKDRRRTARIHAVNGGGVFLRRRADYAPAFGQRQDDHFFHANQTHLFELCSREADGAPGPAHALQPPEAA